MRIEPLTGGLGAEIFGADPECPEDMTAIRAAFASHSVIVLRGQEIDPEGHIRFAEGFGPININRFFKPLEGYPQIATVIKEPDQKQAVGEGWHTDHSYDEEPALGSILRAVEMPSVGGDTIFASMAMAYEALSPAMQTFLEGLYAWHSSRHVFGATVQNSEAARSGRLSNAE
jgi:taurine dioxygenase